MKTPFDKILYGGDYNPNQWPREIWDADMRMFKKAGINSVTINVFSWAKLQPSEDRYDFSELDSIIEMLSRENMGIVLATATAALPAWMVKRYPEVARTDYEGRVHRFGGRHNACPNSPVYKKYSKSLAGKLAERYAGNEHVICWHVNNEYGGICYCENCEKAFRVWLREKYGTLDALNKAWNTEFWGHTFYDWDEIVTPNLLGDGLENEKTAFSGISLDYYRFNSDSLLHNFISERDAIRRYDAKTPVTTNIMGTYKQLDYFKWATEMDIISWDNYPAFDTPWSLVAMQHDLMRGLKQQPFMLMEQTPSQQNWQRYNSLKKPGQMRAQSYQTIAHGGDTIQFFQLRRSVGAVEKFHGAVIGHAGTDDTRVFREVTRLGQELAALGTQTLGAGTPARVGIVFDWDTFWALEFTSGPTVDMHYVEQIHQVYRYFYEHNIPVDMLPFDADFSKYDLVAAPVLYMMKDGMQQALEGFVQAGGTLVTGYMSGIVDQSDNVHPGGYPGPLRKMSGIWVEEIDALAPQQHNTIRFTNGKEATCSLLCDIIHPEGAQCLAEYTSNFYAGHPAVTKNNYGKGSVYYIGTQLEEAALGTVLDMAVQSAGVKPVIAGESKLEITCRTKDNIKYYFILNLTADTRTLPEYFFGKKDILTGMPLAADTAAAPYAAFIVAEQMNQ